MSFDLSEEESLTLQELGLIQPSTASCKRKISSNFLNASPNTDPLSSTSASICASVRVVSETHKPSFMFEVPEDSDTVDGLIFIGLTAEAAAKVFESWGNRPEPSVDLEDLLTYIEAHVSRMKTIKFESLNLSNAEALAKVGISQQTIEAILDPRYDIIFQTETLEHWVMDTLTTNYNTLQSILMRIKQTAIKAVKVRNNRLGIAEELPSADPTSLSTPTVTTNNLDEEHLFFEGCKVTSMKPVTLPNHTTIYKGKAVDGLPIVDSKNNVEFESLRTSPGGDFNPMNYALYFNHELNTAEMYRQYAAIRSANSETMIIEMQVPNNFLASLRIQEIYFSDLWRNFVSLCRSRRRIPADLKHLFTDTDLVKGDIPSKRIKLIENIHSQDTGANLAEDQVMMISGQRCIQWCFMTGEVIDLLAEAVRGKLHIDRFEARSKNS